MARAVAAIAAILAFVLAAGRWSRPGCRDRRPLSASWRHRRTPVRSGVGRSIAVLPPLPFAPIFFCVSVHQRRNLLLQRAQSKTRLCAFCPAAKGGIAIVPKGDIPLSRLLDARAGLPAPSNNSIRSVRRPSLWFGSDPEAGKVQMMAIKTWSKKMHGLPWP